MKVYYIDSAQYLFHCLKSSKQYYTFKVAINILAFFQILVEIFLMFHLSAYIHIYTYICSWFLNVLFKK